MVKARKLYFIDNGLRNGIFNNYYIYGQLSENYVFSELVKIGMEPKYWRSKSKAEVDFIIENQNEICAIEVKELLLKSLIN